MNTNKTYHLLLKTLHSTPVVLGEGYSDWPSKSLEFSPDFFITVNQQQCDTTSNCVIPRLKFLQFKFGRRELNSAQFDRRDAGGKEKNYS